MKTLTFEQTKRLERLAQRPASEIDLSDIPETTNWEGAVRGWENHPARARSTVNLHLSANLERRLQEVARACLHSC